MKLISLVVTSVILSFAIKAIAETDDPAPSGWITATNQPCKIWNSDPQPNESVTWSGPCTDGYASGKGVLRWTENGQSYAEFEGEYANGKRNGAGVITTLDGQRIAGVWLEDLFLVGYRNTI
jgi:hypothetical protein